MPKLLTDAAAEPAALSAFLRGVERRAALLGELQCGDQALADTALAASMRAFRQHAPGVAMAGWPQRFWSLLVAAPPLRHASVQGTWPPKLQTLAALDPLARQALLLRLVAGLSEEVAAEVMGIDLRTYQTALASACPRDADGQPDPQAWRALADTLQQQMRELPPDRLARLARLREAAIAGVRESSAGPIPAAYTNPAASTHLRRWPWAVLVVLLCALALAATWYWPKSGGAVGQAGNGLANEVEIQTEPLPERAPAERFDAASALLDHPDLGLLKDPEEATLVAEADFLAWLAASQQAQPDEPVLSADPAMTGTGLETADAD